MASTIADLERLHKLAANVNLALLILAGAVAVAIAVTSVIAHGLSNKLLSAKDDQVKSDIAGVEANAKREATRIESDAKERITKVETDAGLKIAGLEKEAADQRRVAAELEKRNIETAAKLEAERSTRLELEASLAPRDLPLLMVEQRSNIDRLKEFAGTKFVINVIGDAEVQRAGSTIMGILKAANWVPIKDPKTWGSAPVPTLDGVTLEDRSYAGPRTLESESDLSEKAAVRVAAFLISNNWAEISMRFVPTTRHNELPANTIRIMVGFKPNPYFAEQWEKDVAAIKFAAHADEIRVLADEMRRENEELKRAIAVEGEKLKQRLLDAKRELDEKRKEMRPRE